MAGAEMWNLARNIAEHGAFANPFGVLATGLTAANPPLFPFLLAGLMKISRNMTFLYGAAVVGSIFANAMTAVLLPRVSLVFYGSLVPGIFASVLWMGAMQSIPGWDTSYTVAGILFFCIFTASSGSAGRKWGRDAAVAGTIAGLLCLFNPSSMLVTVPWMFFLLWRGRTNLRRSIEHCGIVLAVLCLFVFGWCGRNYYQLGGFQLRTNLGMTLYASNNGCAQSSLVRDELNGCYDAHHPNTNIGEAKLLQTMGEIQYDRTRIADTKAWIQAHPERFLKLTLIRFVEFWFPAREAIPPNIEFEANFKIPHYTQLWSRRQNRIACAIWIVTALSIPGLLLMARRREPALLFVLAVMVLYPLMYYVVVSDMRYRYPVLWLSLLPAGYFIHELSCRIELAIGKTASDPVHAVSHRS